MPFLLTILVIMFSGSLLLTHCCPGPNPQVSPLLGVPRKLRHHYLLLSVWGVCRSSRSQVQQVNRPGRPPSMSDRVRVKPPPLLSPARGWTLGLVLLWVFYVSENFPTGLSSRHVHGSQLASTLCQPPRLHDPP